MKRLLSLRGLSLNLPLAQSSAPVIEWLTRLQSLESTLRGIPDGAAAEIRRPKGDLRLLRREMEAHPETEGFDLPPPAPSGDRAALPAEASAMRAVLEEQRRRKPGTAFHLARIEFNVTAAVEQLSTATTLDESHYRRRNRRTVPDALSLIPGVSPQRVGPRTGRATSASRRAAFAAKSSLSASKTPSG